MGQAGLFDHPCYSLLLYSFLLKCKQAYVLAVTKTTGIGRN